ncbi:MAG: hypothetical protein ACKOXK_00780 [Chakrabartia sp.]
MKKWLSLALLLVASPGLAERLKFDHRLYPPLQQVLDRGGTEMVDFNNSNPQRLVDLIAIRGSSAQNWTEALEIISIVRPGGVVDAKDWMARLQSAAEARCPAQFAILAQDAQSITFERRSPDCPAERSSYGLYRLVTGKKSWFQLSVLVKDDLAEPARRQWLALLASAHLDR